MNYSGGVVVFDGWKIKKEIGEGAYGKVCKIKKQSTVLLQFQH